MVIIDYCVRDADDMTIQDSLYGTSSMLLADYPAMYQSAGKWNHSYYCKDR